MLPNCEEFIPVWFGILKAGAVMSSINTADKGDFLSWTINLVEAKKLVTSDEYLERLDLVKGELSKLEHVMVRGSGKREGPDSAWANEPLAALMEGSDAEPDGVTYKWTDDARIMFTSGTTGRSKGVIKQNTTDYFSARGLLEVISATAGKSVESVAEGTFFFPACHSFTPTPRCSRATRRWWPARASPTPSASRRAASGSRSSTPRRRSSIRSAPSPTSSGTSRARTWTVLTRSTPVLPPRRRRTSTTSSRSASGVKFIEGYGLTETSMATYMDPTKLGVPGSMGKANPGYEVTIVEPGTDLSLPPDTPGEIVVDQKIPNTIMCGYYARPEKTAEDFRNLKLHTGGLGRMDSDGYFYFVDRVKNYIHGGGENVSSMEVEKQVSDHTAIKEAAAIGVKASEGASSEDEIMVVCIPEGQAPDPIELTHWLAERIPYFMVPRYIRFVDSLSKTPTERVQKIKLREARRASRPTPSTVRLLASRSSDSGRVPR